MKLPIFHRNNVKLKVISLDLGYFNSEQLGFKLRGKLSAQRYGKTFLIKSGQVDTYHKYIHTRDINPFSTLTTLQSGIHYTVSYLVKIRPSFEESF